MSWLSTPKPMALTPRCRLQFTDLTFSSSCLSSPQTFPLEDDGILRGQAGFRRSEDARLAVGVIVGFVVVRDVGSSAREADGPFLRVHPRSLRHPQLHARLALLRLSPLSCLRRGGPGKILRRLRLRASLNLLDPGVVVPVGSKDVKFYKTKESQSCLESLSCANKRSSECSNLTTFSWLSLDRSLTSRVIFWLSARERGSRGIRLMA